MKIRKAVITAAGQNQRTLPLQTFVDRDGTPKIALTIIVEEALNGIEEVAVIVAPAMPQPTKPPPPHAPVRFILQTSPRGYGHGCLARAFRGRELTLSGDHLYSAGKRLLRVTRPAEAKLRRFAVQATHESSPITRRATASPDGRGTKLNSPESQRRPRRNNNSSPGLQG